jgi:ABC-type antimicrobial peptide transport system permease subunit
MAIRMAHGATPGRVLRLILGEGLIWPVAGLATGMVLAGALSGVLRAILYGIAPGEPRIVVAGALVFLLTAVGACLLPAWRASRTSPMQAMRAD